MRSIVGLFIVACVAMPAAADESSHVDQVLKRGQVDPTPAGVLHYLRPESGARLRQLVVQLGDASYATREEAMKKLAKMPVVATPDFSAAMNSSDPEVRYRARVVVAGNRKVRNSTLMKAALEKMDGKAYASALPIVLGLMGQFERRELVMAATDAIRRIAQPSHAALLRKTAVNENQRTDLRIAALQCLGRVGTTGELPVLRKLSASKVERIRLFAAAALLKQKQQEGLTILAGLLNSDVVEIRAESVWFLRTATGKNFTYLAVDQSPARTRAAAKWIAWVKNNGATVKLNDTTRKKLLANPAIRIRSSIYRKFVGHTSTVYSVAFSPDGKRLASVSGDRQVKVWDIQGVKLVWSRQAHNSTARSVAWSPDGKLIATGSYDKTIKLWEAKSGKLLRTLTEHTGWVRLLAFSPDSKRLASTSDDMTVRIWTTANGAVQHVLKGHTQFVRSVNFSRDGRLLASSGSDRTIRLWNAKTGAAMTTLTGHTSSVRSVVFAPDGLTLVSCGFDNTVRMWDISSGKERLTLRGHTLSVKCVDYTRDGRYFISAGNDRTVRIWNPMTGKLITKLTGPTSSIWHAAISPDGTQIAASGSDRDIYLWKLDFSQTAGR